MRPVYFQNLTAFLCITSSFLVIGDNYKETGALPLSARHRPVQQSSEAAFWSGEPTDELEAEIHFYMNPTAERFFSNPEILY